MNFHSDVWINQSLTVVFNWPTANKAFFRRIFLPFDVVVSKIFWINGTAVAGNVDAGIFEDVSYIKIASTGSTAQATANSVQSVTLTNSVKLKAGSYLLGVSTDTTTNCRIGYFSTFNTPFSSILGCYEETTAFPLPATATPVAQTASFLFPAIGMFTPNGAY